MKKALLIIDRGSKMKEVKDELQETCDLIKDRTEYDYVDYCFLEVVPPFIDEGIHKCIISGADSVTIVPYFLYPGMKLKDAVKRSALIINSQKKRMVITKPLSYQPIISEIVLNHIQRLINQEGLVPNENLCLLLIGHGSSDKRAREAFLFTVHSLKAVYKNVRFCFLELEPPNIEEGFRECIEIKPDKIIVIPYFLHKGIHIQKDILVDLEKAQNKFGFKDMSITSHIGVDSSAVNLIISLAKEAESNSGLF